jgi:cytochrome c biogenesis protein CcmG/thiol:disulfide interchange protein DsbE
MRYWLPLLILLVSAGCGPAATPSSRSPALLPAAPLVTIDGDPADLVALVRGRAAVISLWATWCDACSAESGALNRLDEQAGSRGDALVVGVAVGEPRARVAAFARDRGLKYARLVDEDFRLADLLGERRVPTTLVVDRSGRIVYRGGALDAAGLAAFRSALGN